MRSLILATAATIGIGVLGTTGALAFPAGGAALSNAAGQSVTQVGYRYGYYGYGYRYRPSYGYGYGYRSYYRPYYGYGYGYRRYY